MKVCQLSWVTAWVESLSLTVVFEAAGLKLKEPKISKIPPVKARKQRAVIFNNEFCMQLLLQRSLGKTRKCAPGVSRTRNKLLRRQVLYPIELRAHQEDTLNYTRLVAFTGVSHPIFPFHNFWVI